MAQMKLGIIGAMEEEIAPILALFPESKQIALGGNVFYHILYNNADIYVAYSKIGKVHSAITASAMIVHFGCEKIIFCGVAGGLDKGLTVGDLLLGTSLCQHDVDISAFGHPLGFIPGSRVFIQTDENLNAIARQVAAESNISLKSGVIASGDAFIHSSEKKQWIIEHFSAMAVEMEGASVAVVCDSFKVPFCILRSISDSADGQADVSFDEFLDSSAKIVAEFVKKMVDRIVMQTTTPATRYGVSGGFSLIELVFVIAVVGILAAVALPKLVATRTDALYAAINSDIQAVISSTQVAALTQDLHASPIDGNFIMQAAGLSPTRWVAQGNGVRLGKNGALDSANNCVMIDITAQQLQVRIQTIQSSQLCQKLSKTYPTPLQFNLSSTLF